MTVLSFVICSLDHWVISTWSGYRSMKDFINQRVYKFRHFLTMVRKTSMKDLIFLIRWERGSFVPPLQTLILFLCNSSSFLLSSATSCSAFSALCCSFWALWRSFSVSFSLLGFASSNSGLHASLHASFHAFLPGSSVLFPRPSYIPVAPPCLLLLFLPSLYFLQ